MALNDEDINQNSYKKWINSDFANKAMIVIFFASASIFLASTYRLSTLVSTLFFVSFLLAMYLGSVTALMLVGIVSMLSLAAGISIYRSIFDSSVSIRPMILVLFAILFFYVYIFKQRVIFENKWTTEILTLSLSVTSLLLVWDERLRVNGGAIAALYASEDNAAWILTTQRVIQSQGWSSPGDYGALLDAILLISYEASEKIFVGLNTMDYLALSVVLCQVLFIIAIPFVSALASIGQKTTSNSLTSTFIFTIALLLGFKTLNSIGHLSAAIAFVLISSYLILLISYTSWRMLLATPNLSRTYRWLLVAFCSVLNLLLLFQELFRRFAVFKADGGLATGALSLLGFEGGTTSGEPWNLSMVLVISLSLIGLMSLLNLNNNHVFHGVVLLIVYSTAVKTVNLFINEGQANYGSRKVELVVVLCASAFLPWAFVRLFEINLSKFQSAALVGALFSSLSFSMPAANAVIGGNYFSGNDIESNFKTSLDVSRNVEIGVSALCINEEYQADPFAPNRMAAYTCSRWVSAYSFTDDSEKNEWRKAVLAAIPRDQFRAVRDSMPTNTKILIVAPNPGAPISSNPEWEDLVSNSWEIVR